MRRTRAEQLARSGDAGGARDTRHDQLHQEPDTMVEMRLARDTRREPGGAAREREGRSTPPRPCASSSSAAAGAVMLHPPRWYELRGGD